MRHSCRMEKPNSQQIKRIKQVEKSAESAEKNMRQECRIY